MRNKTEGHHIRPSWRNSCTTSCVREHSHPHLHRLANSVEKQPEQRCTPRLKPTFQACSALPLRMDGSDRALALANWHRNDRVSSDHRPPTLPARTTNLARACGPISSGVWLSGELHRPCEQHHASVSHRNATWTPKSCRWPVVCSQTVANRVRQFPAVSCRGRAEQPSPCP